MTIHGSAHSDPASDPLWDAFVDPPDDARPRAWWHWMDGNIDPAGIVRDLRWLHGVGIRGVQLFDGGMGVPLVVPHAVRPETDLWREAIDTAVTTADELGLELAVATSSGWSASGGPWVQPVDAMKKVVWAEHIIDGGNRVEEALPPLPAAAGPYQDAPRWGGSDAAPFATDWTVLAIPHEDIHEALVPADVCASAPIGEWSCLLDGSFAESIALPRDPDDFSSAWVEQSFDQPVTVRSVVVGLPGPRGFGSAPAPSAVLQASDDGIVYRDVVELEPTAVPVRTAAFAPVTARLFRVVLSGASAAAALPAMTEGVRLPPVLRRADSFVLSEFALRTAGRVHHAETKAGFGVVADYYGVETDHRVDAGAIDPSAVIDLTDCVTDGVLRWDAPPGRWRVLRFGASLTGQTNGPAPADSTGLEVDKLDGERVAAYLATHLERFTDTADAETSRFSALLSDSIEAGAQNWTDRILEHFATRRGYDPLHWLPALAGILVDSPERSDRFLFDYRRTLSELIAHEYYGTLAAQARRRGMAYYAEALEDGRPQLGDDLAMRSHADVPMGAMWTFDPEEGPRPTYVADLKGASSVAHVYGKSWTASEAFSSFGNPWSWSPQALKHIADLQLSLGVTRFCIHTSPHQPLTAPPPGIALAPFLGQVFTVAETWSDVAGPWINYLARCCAMLSAGRPALDFAVFVGEEAPVTALFGGGTDEAVPASFDFDYVGADALADVLRVHEGTLSSAGADYRLLYLGGSSRRMTVGALAQIERLLDAGAMVVGLRPESSPSLTDDPERFRQMCDRLWSPGRVIASDLHAAIEALGLRPALAIDGAPVRRITRRIEGALVTFLANPSAAQIELRLTPADGAHLVGWDPVETRRIPLTSVELDSPQQRGFAVTLAPFASLFVLESAEAATEMRFERIELEGEWTAQLPHNRPTTTSPSPRLWTDFGERERGFSGTGVYHHDFTLPAGGIVGVECVLLELECVGDIARIVLNGQDCGVAWTPPFRVDVTDALREGVNSLDIHVATPWRNRLIAEAAAPTGELFAPMTAVFEATATPLPAGLQGSVALLVAR